VLRCCAEKTTIIVPPTNQTVTVGSDITLHCNATTDTLEQRKLKISWLLNGKKIEFGSRTNVAQYDPDKSLKISQAQIDNTGSYTCNASTELDWDAVTVRLTVRGGIINFYLHFSRSLNSTLVLLLSATELSPNSTWLDKTRHDTFDMSSRMHFGCVKFVEQHGSTHSKRLKSSLL